MPWLVLLETAGNQRYIFATNKLRENVGASQLTYLAGVEWARAAARQVGAREILCTSGKAYLSADSEEAAREIIWAVTSRALKQAPGLDLSGVYVEYQDGLHGAIQQAHRLLASRRGMTPGVEARFQRLPVVAECRTSGLPATCYDTDGPKAEWGPRSAQSVAKRKAFKEGINRMRRTARRHAELGIVYTVADLEREADPDPKEVERVAAGDWLAVVHADGNGLGRVFLHFDEHVPAGRDYVETLRAFSGALDDCTYRAFGHALKRLHRRVGRDPLPVVPLVLGGDDLTVVMDGRFAVQFAIDYLEKFHELTGDPNSIIPEVIRRRDGTGPDRVTAAAGVAVVKPHFPFFSAYELAEELIRSAKEYAKGVDEHKPPSAVDFHVLYDASGPDLERIRDSLTAPGGARLVARPYLVAGDTGPRTTGRLTKVMAAVHRKDDGRREIPNSQLHDLRAALFLGRKAAEARYGLVRHRYPAFETLFSGGTLFWPDDRDCTFRTHLLDVIDLYQFWATEPEGGR